MTDVGVDRGTAVMRELGAQTVQDLTLYSTDDLRYLYRQIENDSDDIRVRLLRGDQVVDEVFSYAGMRSIKARGGAFLLNGEKIYLKMVLDQGYWPDSGITACSACGM